MIVCVTRNRRIQWKEERMFFFEKKNQKTFISLGER